MEEKVLPHAVQHVLLFDFLKFFGVCGPKNILPHIFYDSCIFIQQTNFFQFFTIKQHGILKVF